MNTYRGFYLKGKKTGLTTSGSQWSVVVVDQESHKFIYRTYGENLQDAREKAKQSVDEWYKAMSLK